MKTLKSIRLDNDLIACIEVMAKKEVRSFSNMVEHLLTKSIQLKESRGVVVGSPPAKRFVPPTVEEVRSYITSKGYSFDAEAFVAHYEANGWKVGRNKMKSWKAACVTWTKRETKPGKQYLTAHEKMAQSLRDSRDPVKAMDF